MKTILATLVLLFTLSSTALAAEQTVTFTIDKMYCALCPITVSKAMEGVEGVSEVKADYATKLAVATYDDAVTDWQEIALASANAGYPATIANASK